MSSIELFFSDSDSDGDTILEIRRHRRRLRDSLNPLEMDISHFMKNFRLSKEAFLIVLEKINGNKSQGTYSTKIPNILRLAITLRFLAQGSYQLGVGNEGMCGVAQPTVSVVLSEMLNVLENILCPEYISFNFSPAEIDRAKMSFFSKCGIPGVISAIDGTHIKIIGPQRSVQNIYYNRKGFFSINAMIVCDHNMKIRYINAKHPGSCHDSMVFANSSPKLLLEQQYNNGFRNTWLLGDAGYGLKPYLMTPYRNAESGSIESRFNIQHAKGRNVIECTIGVFKSRWRCMLASRALHYAPAKATKMINVCAALHNVCITYNVSFDDEVEIDDSNNDEISSTQDVDISSQNLEAEAIRRQIALSL